MTEKNKNRKTADTENMEQRKNTKECRCNGAERGKPFFLFFSTREFRQWFSKRPIDRRVRSSSGLALFSPFDQSLFAPPRLSPSHSFSSILRQTSILSAH